MKSKLVHALALGVFAFTTSLAYAAGSGVQGTPDQAQVLINKDVGNERWSITLNLTSGGTVTGNVFRTDGPPAFVWCTPTRTDDLGSPAQDITHFACYGADECLAAPCGAEQWQLIAPDIQLPGSFFLP
jgi:hypothetical protein